MRSKILWFLLVFAQWSFSQAEKPVSGRVIVKDATVEGVHVVNLVNEREAITNAKGEFTILAKPDDVLVFSAVHLDYMRKIIEDRDYESGFFTIGMTSKINQLDEVRVSNIRMDAVSMGILKKPAKTYTPAERRLKTATDLDPKFGAGMMVGAAVSLDPLLNWMSGRTKLLKSELKIEKKELLLKRLSGLYEDEYYIEKLHIPKDYIKGFQYYCIDEEKFAQALKSKNKFMTTFLIGRLAAQYNNLIHYEGK